MIIYILTEDTRYREHMTSVHLTKETLHAEMRGLIEVRLAQPRSTALRDDPDGDAEHEAERRELQRLLDAGQVDKAWRVFNEGIRIAPRVKNPMDLYYVDEIEIAATPTEATPEPGPCSDN